MMDFIVPWLSKLFNRRKYVNNSGIFLNDHLFLHNRDFLRRLTCSNLFVMDLVVHGLSKTLPKEEENQQPQELPERSPVHAQQGELHHIFRHLTCSKTDPDELGRTRAQ